MTDNDIRNGVLKTLAEVVPELDEAALTPTMAFREQLDLDSIDFLRFIQGLSKRFAIDVPESDYRELTTLESCVRHLTKQMNSMTLPRSPLPNPPQT